MKTFLLALGTLLILSGCAGKQYFEPEETEDYEGNISYIDSDILTFNRSGATLNSGHTLSKNGVSHEILPEDFEFVNFSNNVLIATNNKDKILLNGEIIELKDVVIAASLDNNNNLALVFSNNTIAIYNLTQNRFTFREYFKESVANDIRITNPVFLDNLILFPTLDGKVIVVNKEQGKAIKTITVDPDSTFNNIIYLDTIGETLIAATNNKIIAVSADNLTLKDYEIREVITTDKNIYIATIDGQLIKLDLDLNQIGNKKYKFAKFYALGFKDALYALESQGFLIKIDEDFIQDTIYDFSFSEEAKTITIDGIIYFEDKYLTFE